MRLSVIVPTLNESAFIRACLQSVRAEFTGEVLVVDGGSRDGTRAAAMEAGARVWESPEPGLAQQCNLGAREAMGSVLLFLSADCRLPSGWYRAMENALQSPYVVGGGYRLKLDGQSFAYKVLSFGGNFRSRYWKIALGDQGLFVRKEVYFSIGGMQKHSEIPYALLSFELKKHGEFCLLSNPMVSSVRKWKDNGVLQTTLKHMWTYIKFKYREMPKGS